MAAPGITRERVLAEALRIVDREGLRALSMRRLGAACGVSAMSLYHHVPSKTAVLDGVVGAVLAEIAIPDRAADGDWRAALAQVARSTRAALLRHPAALPVLATRPALYSPEGVRLIEWQLALLHEAGFPSRDAMYAARALGTYVTGDCLASAAGHLDPSGAPKDFDLDEAYAFLRGLDRASTPVMLAMLEEVGPETWDDDDVFELGLSLVLDGMAARLADARAKSRTARHTVAGRSGRQRRSSG